MERRSYHTNPRVETRRSVTTIISILNKTYKILSKIIINRLKVFAETLCRVGFRVLVAPDRSLSWGPHSGWSIVSMNWWDSILHVLLAKKHMGCTTRQSCRSWEVFATRSAREFEFMCLICLSAKFSKSTSYQKPFKVSWCAGWKIVLCSV